MDNNMSYLLILTMSTLVFNRLCSTCAYTLDLDTQNKCGARHELDNWVTSCGAAEHLETVGIDIDFSYNETNFAGSKGRSSVPGCPKSMNGIPWVYYKTPPKCPISGKRNECKLGSTLLPVEGSTFGKCVCNCLVDRDFPKERKIETENFIQCTGSSKNLRFRHGEYGQGQIYDKRRSKCFNIGFQEECEIWQRVTGLSNELVVCEHRNFSWALVDPAIAGIGENRCPDGFTFASELEECLANTVITEDSPY